MKKISLKLIIVLITASFALNIQADNSSSVAKTLETTAEETASMAEETVTSTNIEAQDIQQELEADTQKMIEEGDEIVNSIIEADDEENKTPEVAVTAATAPKMTAPCEDSHAETTPVKAQAPVIETPTANNAPVVETNKEVTPKIEIEENTDSKEIIQSASLKENALSSGFYNFSYDCSMRTSAELSGSIVGVIRKGKKLWVDPHQGGWVKVYRTTGPAYVSQDCI